VPFPYVRGARFVFEQPLVNCCLSFSCMAMQERPLKYFGDVLADSTPFPATTSTAVTPTRIPGQRGMDSNFNSTLRVRLQECPVWTSPSY